MLLVMSSGHEHSHHPLVIHVLLLPTATVADVEVKGERCSCSGGTQMGVAGLKECVEPAPQA